jgi:hypothetical protein
MAMNAKRIVSLFILGLVSLLVGNPASAQVALDFPDSLMSAFPGYANHQSLLQFNYGGNDFE